MILLNTQFISQQLLPNNWQQVSVVLQQARPLQTGSRLQLGRHTLAPWRISGQHVDCLMMPDHEPIDLNAALLLTNEGQPLPIPPHTTDLLLISGEDLGIADALHACQKLRTQAQRSLVLLSSNCFPFIAKPAKFMVPSLPALIACCPLLEDWGFANRLANTAEQPGCYDGNLTDLLNEHLKNHTDTIYNIRFHP